MTTTLACPDETELLALAMGEPVAAAVTAHVDGCAELPDQARSAPGRGGVVAAEPRTRDDTPIDRTRPRGGPRRRAAGCRDDSDGVGRSGTPSTDPLGPEAVAAARDRAEGQGAMPDAIGRYKVVGRLDGGGEADVYRVVHIKLGNDLVLKLSRRPVGADSQSGLVE